MHIRDIRSDIDAIDAYPAFITRQYFIKNFGVINDPTRSSTSVKSLGHLRVKQQIYAKKLKIHNFSKNHLSNRGASP